MIIWWFWDWKELNNQLISTKKHEPIGSHSKHYTSPFELRAALLHHLPKLLPLSISSFISIYCFILFWHFSPKVPYHHSKNQWLLHMRRSHHNLQLEDLQISNPSIWNPSRSPPWIMGWIVAHSSGDVYIPVFLCTGFLYSLWAKIKDLFKKREELAELFSEPHVLKQSKVDKAETFFGSHARQKLWRDSRSHHTYLCSICWWWIFLPPATPSPVSQ